MTPPYKDNQGRFMTINLFIEKMEEQNRKTEFEPPMSLLGRPGYIDARREFLERRDPTGYSWAVDLLGDYRHLKRLHNANWFVDIWNEWLEELNLLMRSEAIDEIKRISQDEAVSDSQRLAAAKYLAGREWEKADKSTRRGPGRPSKAEVRGALKEAVDMSEQTREEFDRIGLKVVK